MKTEKSFWKSIEEGNYDRVKGIMRSWMDGLGYELVKDDSSYLKELIMVCNNTDFLSGQNGHSCIYACNCCHFTNSDTYPEGIIHVLHFGEIFYPHKIEIERSNIIGYGEPWKNDTWWRKRRKILPCSLKSSLAKEVFIPKGVETFYTVLPEEIVEKLKNK